MGRLNSPRGGVSHPFGWISRTRCWVRPLKCRWLSPALRRARSDEPAPNPPVTPLRESAAQHTVRFTEEETVPMQVARMVEVRSAPARPGRDNCAQVAKPRATTLARPVGAAPPRPRDPRKEGSRQETRRLVCPSASVAAPLVARSLGISGVARGARPAVRIGQTIHRLRPPSSSCFGSCKCSWPCFRRARATWGKMPG